MKGKRSSFRYLFIILIVFNALADEKNPVAWWTFDEASGSRAIDSATGIADSVEGHFRHAQGVRGNGLKCDGYTTRIIRSAKTAPIITGAFTVEAWVAPQSYPWNWCAVVNQEYEHQRGFFFGIDAEGRIGLHLAVKRQWRECVSEVKIPFMEWSHIAGTFDPEKGITLYVNGKQAGRLSIPGGLLVDIGMNLEIARNHKRTVPTSLNRAGRVRIPASYSFDGIIDELKIYTSCLSADEAAAAANRGKPAGKPALRWRTLPQLPPGPREFGGYYTNLKYDEDWDSYWRVADHPDIVVTFEHNGCAMVFWKGTNYNMNLVTENGKWIADQSAEGGGPETKGCSEHMSDKQNRYSHVRLIENNDARVVVHWRYAVTDVLYQIANVDPVTDWGDWVDEYYTIYPDGIAVRHFMIHGKNNSYSITEPAALSNPGEKPEDNVNLDAVTLANLIGEKRTYSFETWPSNGKVGADFDNPVPDATVSLYNFKSRYKPFYVYEPGTRNIPYGGGIREIDYSFSHFHARNHWPVSLIPCDGRFVLAADRVTSSAITSPEPPMVRNPKSGALEGRFIMGLTDKPVDTLLPMAKFWLNAPAIETIGMDFSAEGFDRNERAYCLKNERGKSLPMELVILAGQDKPVCNPVFIIRNWGKSLQALRRDGKPLNAGEDFRHAIRKTLEGNDLIVWMKIESDRPVKLSFE